MPQPRSSGDLLADRRYAWAEASLAGGDASAACGLAEQVLERVPGYAPAWLLLGEARAASPGHSGAAREAFERARLLDPTDTLGAGVHLARLGLGDGVPTPGYVRALYDGYADRFDRHLLEGLGYRAPALLREAVEAAAQDAGLALPFPRALDLGCGTGLMGAALDGLADTLVGVDLSPAMLAKATRTGRYAALHEGDLLAYVDDAGPGSYELAVAADVLVYVGELAPVIAGVARVLADGGVFAFTLQAHAGVGARLGPDGRYAHGEAHVREAAAAAGLRTLGLGPATTRRERGEPVPCWLAVLGKTSRARP